VGDPSTSQYFISGWSEQVEGSRPLVHRWSEQSTAFIRIPAPLTSGRVTLTLEGVPYVVEGRVPHQDVHVFVEGVFTAFARLGAPGAVSGVVPGWVVRPGQVDLTVAVVTPDSVVPSSLGLGDDQRILGIALQRLTISA
jgi:hypothetical protein